MKRDDNRIAGAMYSLTAWLTGLKPGITVGDDHGTKPVLDAMCDWADHHGLDCRNPDVEGWSDNNGLRAMKASIDESAILEYISGLEFLPVGDELLTGPEMLIRDILEKG